MHLVGLFADEFDDVDLGRPAAVDGKQPDRGPHALSVRELGPNLPLAVLLFLFAFGGDVTAGVFTVADPTLGGRDVHSLAIHHNRIGRVVLKFPVMAPSAVRDGPAAGVRAEAFESGIPDGDVGGKIFGRVRAIDHDVIDPDLAVLCRPSMDQLVPCHPLILRV